MGVYTHENEIAIALPPAKAFNAFFPDGDVLLTKVFPDHFKDAEIIEGDGGAGTIKKINFFHEGEASYMIHKIEEVDKEKLVYKYTIFEGSLLKDKIEKISYEIKIVAEGAAGSIFKSESKYYPIGDYKINEEEIKVTKEKGKEIVKAVEAYILAHPDEF